MKNPILDNTDLQTPKNIEVVSFSTLEEAKEFINENNLTYESPTED